MGSKELSQMEKVGNIVYSHWWSCNCYLCFKFIRIDSMTSCVDLRRRVTLNSKISFMFQMWLQSSDWPLMSSDSLWDHVSTLLWTWLIRVVLFAPLSEFYGRKPIYVISYLLFTSTTPQRALLTNSMANSNCRSTEHCNNSRLKIPCGLLRGCLPICRWRINYRHVD